MAVEKTRITGEEAISIAHLLIKETNAVDGFMELFYKLLRQKVERGCFGGH